MPSSVRSSVLVAVEERAPGVDPGRWREAGFPVRELGRGDSTGDIVDRDLIVIDGTDRFVGRVATACLREADRPAGAAALSPVGGRGLRTVADALEAPTPSDLPIQALADADDLRCAVRDERLGTLQVTPSVDGEPSYGFTLGAGLFETAFEAYSRGTGAGWSGLRSALTEVAGELADSGAGGVGNESARMTVDYRPEAEEIGFALVSSLPRTWLGLSLGGGRGPRYMSGAGGGEAVRRLLRAGTLPGSIHGEGSVFDRIHLDWSAGYVLDGRLKQPGVPYVLQIAAGPTLDFRILEGG